MDDREGHSILVIPPIDRCAGLQSSPKTGSAGADMVNIRVTAGYIAGALLIISGMLGAKVSLDNANRYGWTYDVEVRIEGDTFIDVLTDTISIRGELIAVTFMVITGILLITSSYTQGSFSFITSKVPVSTNIEFIQNKPEHFDIWYDPNTYSVGVVLDGVGISIPMSMIDKWRETPE